MSTAQANGHFCVKCLHFVISKTIMKVRIVLYCINIMDSVSYLLKLATIGKKYISQINTIML